MSVDEALSLAQEDKHVSIWYKLLRTTMGLPGVRIDRTSYLRKELFPRCNEEQIRLAIEQSPAKANIPLDVIDGIANSCIKWHVIKATAVSTASGIPGGWWIAGTIPVDMAQFYWHILALIQKLAYLYGWPELIKAEDEFDDETLSIITIFIGVMFGVENAVKGLVTVSEAFAQQVAKRLPQLPLTKHVIFRIAREIAKWLGIKLTKDGFGKLISRAIPIVGGVMAGGTTCLTMSSMANQLKNHLKDLPIARGDV